MAWQKNKFPVLLIASSETTEAGNYLTVKNLITEILQSDSLLVCSHLHDWHHRTYLLFQLNRDCISLLEEYGVSPEIIPQGSELMVLPLPETPCSQLVLSITPVALCVKQGVD
jgi:hypothetical protein